PLAQDLPGHALAETHARLARDFGARADRGLARKLARALVEEEERAALGAEEFHGVSEYCGVGVFGLRGVDGFGEGALMRCRAHAALRSEERRVGEGVG